jgi:hypothetical protein
MTTSRLTRLTHRTSRYRSELPEEVRDAYLREMREHPLTDAMLAEHRRMLQLPVQPPPWRMGFEIELPLASEYDGAMSLSVPLGNRSHLPAGLAWSTSPEVAPAPGLPTDDSSSERMRVPKAFPGLSPKNLAALRGEFAAALRGEFAGHPNPFQVGDVVDWKIRNADDAALVASWVERYGSGPYVVIAVTAAHPCGDLNTESYRFRPIDLRPPAPGRVTIKPHKELEPGAQPPSFAWTWFELTTTFKNATGRQ